MTKIEVLLKEYELMKMSYNDVIKEYRKQSNILNTYVTLFIGLTTFVIANGGFDEKILSLEINILPLILIISGFLMIYFYSMILDIIYHLYLTEAQLSSIEVRINNILGEDVVNYDSKIISYFNESIVTYKEWLNPSYFVGIIGFFFMFLFAVIHVMVAMIFTSNLVFQTVYSVVLISLTAYILFQFYQLNGNGRVFIKKEVFRINKLPLQEDLIGRVMFINSNFSFVAIATFLFGFVSFLIFSISSDSFLPNSSIDIPLVYQYTIMIGDSFFLPIINFMYFRLIFEKITNDELTKNKYKIIWVIFITFIISLILNIATHYIWAMDKYSDFIALSIGEISFGGWWHLIFSIFQSTIFLSFPFFWYICIKSGNKENLRYSRKIWVFSFLFSMLMIFNFLHQKATIYSELSFLHAIIEYKFAFFNIFLSLVILFIMEVINKRMKKLHNRINYPTNTE